MTIYLVRHAHAGKRHKWKGDDRERPLSDGGREQAAGLIVDLGDRPISRVVSSPSLRCRQTVAPLAKHLGLEVEICDPLDESTSNHDALELLRSLAGDEAVLCSHGDVIPDLIRALADDGMKMNGRDQAAKGGTFVIEVDGGRFSEATYLGPRA